MSGGTKRRERIEEKRAYRGNKRAYRENRRGYRRAFRANRIEERVEGIAGYKAGR